MLRPVRGEVIRVYAPEVEFFTASAFNAPKIQASMSPEDQP